MRLNFIAKPYSQELFEHGFVIKFKRINILHY